MNLIKNENNVAAKEKTHQIKVMDTRRTSTHFGIRTEFIDQIL